MIARGPGRRRTAVAAACLVLVSALTASGARAGVRQVIFPRGQRVEIALVVDQAQSFTQGFENAVHMAVQKTPTIDGYPVQVLTYKNATCDSTPAAVDANAAAARSVVANPHVVAVIGHECSYAFGAVTAPGSSGCAPPFATSALSIYQSAGIPTINGSATNPCLPPVGKTVFNRTAAADPGFDEWYRKVEKLPSDLKWEALYTNEFHVRPTEWADLYYDAANMLLAKVAAVAHLKPSGTGNVLVIDRAALAAAIRHTTDFPAVSCPITIDPATGNRKGGPAAIGPGCMKTS